MTTTFQAASSTAKSATHFFGLDVFETQGVFGTGDPVLIISRLINIALQFLGVIFVVIILLIGLRLMLSGGEAEKIADAKKSFINALIGLFLILTSYAIVNFILNAFSASTASSGTITNM